MSITIPDRPFLTRLGDLAKDLTVQTAVLDRFGIIVAVNEPWQRSSERIRPSLPEFGRIGENYFRNCAFADPLSPRLIRGLSQVISGEVERLSLVYSCENEGNSPDSFFLMLAFPHPENAGHIVVMHIDVTVLMSIFTTFRREFGADDTGGDASARSALQAGGADHSLVGLLAEEADKMVPPHGLLQRKERHAPLSKRQTDVLALMTKGMTNAEIANELGLSLNTVKVYVSGILARLGLQSRAQVLHWALTRRKDEGES